MWGNLILLMLLGLALAASVWLFRRGMRDAFITDGPFGKIALYTLGLQLLIWLVERIAADADAEPLLYRFAIGGTLFILGSGAWLLGFIHGRWRSARGRGILRTRD